MYFYDMQVGYSECSPTEEIKISSIVNLLQNCSMLHSDSIGFDLKHYYDIKKAWLLSSWQIEIEELPKHAQKIRVCTKPYDFKGFYGMRNFWIEDEAGKILIKANSVWFFMDLVKGLPVKVTEQELEGYGIEDKIDMEYEDRRIKISKDAVFEPVGEPIPVCEFLLDTNRHVNNGQYIKIAYELLQRHGEKLGVKGQEIKNAGFYPNVRQIRAEYVKAAKYGDTFYGSIYRENEKSFVKLSNKEGDVYSIISFKCE